MKRLLIILCSLCLVIFIIAGCSDDIQKSVPDISSPGISSDTSASSGNEKQETPAKTENDTDEDDIANTNADSSYGADIPVVYMTREINPESLIEIYQALGVEPFGNIAIKVHTGEPPNSNYLRPELIGDLVRSIGGTIVETNAVAGNRASNAKHLQVAKDHGFLDLAPFDLLDADGEVSISVNNGEVLSEVIVGVNVPNYDFYVVLSHFKGHGSAGYGGAIKNVSIGLASAPGKSLIHSAGARRTGYTGDQDKFLKGMAEACAGIIDYFDGNFIYINVMNRLSVDCDCMGNPAKPDMHDIGILASLDPVALDQACVDLVYAAPDGASLIRRIESRNGIHTLEHAAAIGLGSREYILVSIDD